MFEKRTMQPREKIIIDNMRAIKRITKEKLIEVNTKYECSSREQCNFKKDEYKILTLGATPPDIFYALGLLFYINYINKKKILYYTLPLRCCANG